MNRELLEKPFEPDQIKQREGRDGTLDYVEGHSVIARLNEAFDGRWSFEIVRHDILEERNEILVVGKLSAEGVVKMQFGASRIERDDTTKEIVCLADDLKAAGTDALKKCATFLGVGLHLYGERPASRATQGGSPRGEERGRGGNGRVRRDRPSKAETTTTQPVASGNGREPAGQGAAPETQNRTGDSSASNPATPASLPAPQGTTGRPNSPPAPVRQTGQAGNGRLDNAQHTAILALAKQRRLSQLELNQKALKRYGVQIPYLTYRDAADFIQELQSA
jgi:hypothetical protein